MTPYEIDVLLHYYCRAEDHEDIVRNPPVWRPTIERFHGLNLMATNGASDPDPMCYRLTERGRAYCEALQAVPLPEQAWVTHWPPGADAGGPHGPRGDR